MSSSSKMMFCSDWDLVGSYWQVKWLVGKETFTFSTGAGGGLEHQEVGSACSSLLTSPGGGP